MLNMKMNKHKYQKEKGALLVEFLISIFLIALLCLAIAATGVNQEKAILRAANLAQGSNTANTILTNYTNTSYSSVIDVSDTVYEDPLITLRNAVYNVKTYEITPNRLKLVTIKLRWGASSASQDPEKNYMEISTFKSNDSD